MVKFKTLFSLMVPFGLASPGHLQDVHLESVTFTSHILYIQAIRNQA